MIYGILAGNKLYLSEIAYSMKEKITLKTTHKISSSKNSSFITEPAGLYENLQARLWYQINTRVPFYGTARQ